MSRVRIKICGVTMPEDALAAAAAGADAVGAVLSPGFAPSVTFGEGRAVFACLPPFVAKVALFVDPTPEFARGAIDEAKPDLLQFHGGEDESLCGSFGRPYIKAFPVKAASDIISAMESHAEAAGFLLDGFSEAAPGGTGTKFDWALLRGVGASRPVIVAGGLTPDNVGEAIRVCTPYGVDVSSGVCLGGDRRRKDPDKIRSFIRNARGGRS